MANFLKLQYLILTTLICNSINTGEYQSIQNILNSPQQEILSALDNYEPSKAQKLIQEHSCFNIEILNKAIEKYKQARKSKFSEKEIQERFVNDSREYFEIIKCLCDKLGMPLNIEEICKEANCCPIL